ncbi:PadR family transcriptional regulator [Rhodoplanes roseus]|uniref:Transcription regulator PadR N-terminal domain-containing protein n=1 Tax=Rhodoplanes roseus TaxID=29409 RepID=A0A327KZU6_9BRAD|nr:PadR family transcriptional regulator [Rhodoplanes roseus]RAI43155.1 hypothetical protein CH341_15775 [Rhodoplanes roseus]
MRHRNHHHDDDGPRHGHHGHEHGRFHLFGWWANRADGDRRGDPRLGDRDAGDGPRGRPHRRHGHDGPPRGERDGFGRGGGGRFFGSGDLRLLLLWLIGESPSHGYELIKEVEKRLGGTYSPSPGSVYPILSLLEDMGQIRATSTEGGKKLFEITDDGRRAIAEERATIDGILSRIAIVARTMGGMRPPEPIFQVFQTLKTAVALNPRPWTDDEVARVCRIVNAAIAEIQADDRDAGLPPAPRS